MDMQISRQQAAGGASGHLTIDLGALRDNYLTLAGMAPASQTAAVVKADAYGLGADIVSQTLFEAGCRNFFVAHIDEALALRLRLSAEARIFVLNGLQPGNETSCAAMAITPVLNSLEQIAQWSAHARELGKTLTAAVQIDTGMCRLGLSPEELEILSAQPQLLDGIEIAFVMSHLACADEPDHVSNAAQLAVMRKTATAFPETPVCFSNSGGIFLGNDYHNALLRPGIALYGGAPSAAGPNPMKPVVRLDVAVIQTRTVPAGSLVGYGGSFTASVPTRLATIAAGYADGLPRSLSNRGAAWYNGVRLPIAGRISMDSIILDISALPEGALTQGSLVQMIGPDQTLEDIANDAGTIAYEILTGLGRRYRRSYIQPGMSPATASTSVNHK
ncbi:alanine racemase [Agrobacterium fabrum]|uniref:alanine racemase n=1 Tax=Agrobacterium fabrum TaxID=1176649 RepID=UPI0009BB98CA|nr:alanine racemase [Agrobacterium fabrum]UXT59134.1 alanine racemase [Agrobacterium fabrum]WCK79269.1 alanine racemase [Agrobacterium fabrum]WIE30330.1 alanine racemase [Agrobacterium fabrum]WIE46290.1 alanine racemase [Agrobacterium fabrum]CUX49175.1 Alanine racemase, catabolic [Agrobacterium fabrum str. J-07]